MPQVPISPLQDVQPNLPSPSYQQGADNALPFGAALGAGESAVGQSVGQDADIAGKIGADLAIQADMRTTKDAATQSMLYANNLGFKGDGTPQNPNGFFAMRGQQALAYAPQYLAAVKGQQDQTMQGMTPRQQQMYGATADTHLASQTATAQRFVMQQNEIANTETAQARQQAATSTAMNTYNDPQTVADNAKIVRGAVADQNPGATPEILAAKTQAALGKYYGDLAQTALNKGDVANAVSIFETNQTQMDPVSRNEIGRRLLVPMQNAKANAWINENGGATTTLGDGTSPTGSGTPRGLRNNNPLNLEAAGQDGMTGSDGRFGTYSTMEAGIAANAKQIQMDYNNHGQTTLASLIGDPQHGWSPQKDPSNPTGSTANYVAAVSKELGIGANDDIGSLIKDPGGMGKLVTAMARFEGGGKVPTADQVSAGVGGAFGGKLPSAVEQAASPATTAAVAAQTAVHPDFAALKEKAMAAFGDDAEMLPKVLNGITKRESQFNQQNKAQVESLTKQIIPDLKVALQLGRDDTPIPELTIRHAFDGPTADAIMMKLNEWREDGQVYKTVQTMTPEQYSTARSQLVDSLGGTALPAKDGKNVTPAGETAPTGAGITGIAQRAAALDRLDRGYARFQADLKADPAGFLRNNTSFPDIEAGFKATDPVGTAAAIQKSMDTQRSLGIDQPRAISNRSAGILANQINTISPDKGDIGGELAKMQNQYGPAWGSVWKDIVRAGVNPSFAALPAMDTPEQATAKGDLQRALQDKAIRKDEFGKNLDPLVKSAAETQIQSNVQKLRGVMAPYNSNSTFDSVIMPAINTLATHYMEQGVQGADAADRAYNGVIGAKYDISGKLMVPKSVGMDKVIDAANNLTAGLKDADLTGTTAREARAAEWATLPDMSGAGLVKKTLQGGYMPVRRSDGSYVTLPFKGLPDGPGPQASVDKAPNVGAIQ